MSFNQEVHASQSCCFSDTFCNNSTSNIKSKNCNTGLFTEENMPVGRLNSQICGQISLHFAPVQWPLVKNQVLSS